MAKKTKNPIVVPFYLMGQLYDQIIGSIIGEPVEEEEQNIIFFTGKLFGHMIDAVKDYAKKEKKEFRIGLIIDSKQKLDKFTESHLSEIDLVIKCDTQSSTEIQKALMPYQNQILSVTCRSEDQIPLLARILPNVPYIKAPTTESLEWSTDKISMRERLATFDKNISPPFKVVTDAKAKTLKDLNDEVGFPMIIKPSGMRASQLVTICFHKEELEASLKRIFKKIKSAYEENDGIWEPKVLVEQYMEGQMYTIDGYVTSDGKLYFCPIVSVKTGRSIGFDDFFGYQQMTPTLLNEESIAQAEETAAKAIIALGLRSTSVHIEMMKTEAGWKIIEMGPRVGGFRHMLYQFAHGMNHTMNDVLVRKDKKPVIPKKPKGFAVAMKFFAKSEGKLKSLVGIKKARELKSFKRLYTHKKVGDPCSYAKHGGKSVFDIIMFNKERSELLADIRRLEQMIKIETE